MRRIHLFVAGVVLFSTLGLGVGVHAENTASTFLGKLTTGEKKAPLEHYIDEPDGFDIAENGKVIIADTTNHDIKVINRAGTKMRTLAGTHRPGLKNGKAHKAQFSGPKDVAVKGAKGKIVFVADTGNNVIRKINKKGKVSTLAEGFDSPSAIDLVGNMLFVADTGNDRIVGVNIKTGDQVEYASGDNLSGVDELIYWKKHRAVIFANDAGEIRSVNVNTGKVSKALVSGFEDIGGITRDGRDLYIVSSTDIGVYNQIYRYRLKKANNKKVVRLATTSSASSYSALDNEVCGDVTPEPEDCIEVIETDSINTSSDVEAEEESIDWEDAYDWEEDELYEEEGFSVESDQFGLVSLVRSTTDKIADTPDEATCLDFGEVGEAASAWTDTHYVELDTEKDWQSAEYELSADYQGDQPFFRVTLEYTGEDATDEHVGTTENGLKIASTDPEVPANFAVSDIGARSVTFTWDRPEDTDRYFIQLLEDGEQVKKYGSFNDVATATLDDSFVSSNTAYTARIFACGDSCGEYSDEISFRTLPPTVNDIGNINPSRGKNIEPLENGNYAATLKFELRSGSTHNREDLRAKVQLCSEDLDHPDTITTTRLRVLYSGGSSLVSWDAEDLNDSEHEAGEQRFLDRFGKKKKARPGRPKDVAFSSNGRWMYVSQNNKIAAYNFKTKKYKEIAGHVMDSYTEGTGDEARMSDPSGIDVYKNWIFFADRNNHRIRKVNRKTGVTKYITGAGPVNYSFETTDATYQEGAACADELELENSSCAYFNRPTDVAVTDNGKFVYVADASNNRIRRVNAKTGKTKLIAGSGTAGFSDGVGSDASFNGPYSLTLNDDDTKLYVADKYNHAIREIDLSTNAVTTVTGTGSMGLRDGAVSEAVLAIPEYVHVDSNRVYWTEAGSHTVRYADLTSSTVYTIGGQGDAGFQNGDSSVSKFNNPKGIGVRNGKLFIADYYSDLIRRIAL